MRLALRTGLASLVAASTTLVVGGAVYRSQFDQRLTETVDAQLRDRADTAPILAAVAGRLSASELASLTERARVVSEEETVDLGRWPADSLPAPTGPGWSTSSADGQRWRLYTIAVPDVPKAGDQALVQLAAPLGAIEIRAREVRRQILLVFTLLSILAGLAGYLLGLLAAGPLRSLRRDTERIDDSAPETWRVGTEYGATEVDEVAKVLNTSLERLAEQNIRRMAALATARAFAASASHELRTPLQSAMTSIDVARNDHVEPEVRSRMLAAAQAEVRRMATALAAVRALADAESPDPAWFESTDLADVVEAAVAREAGRRGRDPIDVLARGATHAKVWRDGVELAVANLLRNARVHGVSADGTSRIRVTVAAAGGGHTITVEDAGDGIPIADRARVLDRFERGGNGGGNRVSVGGSGLGLTIARQVAIAHGGDLVIEDSSLGGARITLSLAYR
ncbi:MAG: sensor histidine kinase [Nocardioides sp.]